MWLDSAFEALSKLTPNDWKKDIKVVFINEQGVAESGIDGGGLFKEFVDELLKDMFSPRINKNNASSYGDLNYYDLFLTTATGLLVPNPSVFDESISSQWTLEQYSFMGKMLGKAVYENILVEPQFAGMFLNHLLGRMNFIDDLVTLDQEVSLSPVLNSMT